MSEVFDDQPGDLELEPQGELLLVGYDWLRISCTVIQTMALIIIAVTLVARL